MLGPCWRNKPSATAQRDESYWSAAIRTGDCSPTAQTCRETGVGKCPHFGNIGHHLIVAILDHIPNGWVMFNGDI